MKANDITYKAVSSEKICKKHIDGKSPREIELEKKWITLAVVGQKNGRRYRGRSAHVRGGY